MNRKIAGIVAALLMALLVSTGAVIAQGEANVSTVCTEFGTVVLPPGPPPAQGVIAVVVKGNVVTTAFVPGPCAAPGFVARASS